jgi:hypothetical protein
MASNAWDDYFSSWASRGPSLVNKRVLKTLMTDETRLKRLFIKRGENNVRITDVDIESG